MIPRTIPTWQTKSWQEELSSMVTTTSALMSRLQLSVQDMPGQLQTSPNFPVRVTDSFISKIELGNWNDPLLRQIWPMDKELEQVPGYSPDPLGEVQKTPIKGIIHKYHGRVLLVSQAQCAIHCRYCFRREFDYSSHSPSKNEWRLALNYIRQNSDIEEVILSGGDPLVSSNARLQWLLEEIGEIDHITTLRIHTRIPLVLPSRVDEGLIDLLSSSRLQKVIVIHSNHAKELDTPVKSALEKLALAKCTLLNQSVLLSGINDNETSLIQLSKKLFSLGVMPYYLHLLDKVSGAAHFNVDPFTAKQLIKKMRDTLPGYLVPRLVKEEAGASSKTPVV